jgi:hypothetical protein
MEIVFETNISVAIHLQRKILLIIPLAKQENLSCTFTGVATNEGDLSCNPICNLESISCNPTCNWKNILVITPLVTRKIISIAILLATVKKYILVTTPLAARKKYLSCNPTCN